MYCPSCGESISDDSDFCRSCGAEIQAAVESDSDVTNGEPSEPLPSNTGAENIDSADRFKNTDQNHPPSFSQAFIPYFLPWGSNENEMKRRLGGCPSCGEGRNLKIDGGSFIGDPTGTTIECKQCGTRLEGNKLKLNVTEGSDDLKGVRLTLDNCQAIAKARREGDTEKIQRLISDLEENEKSGWNPVFPISSVFISILLIWSAIEYANLSLVFFGIPGILVIPRVRRYIVPWIGEKTNLNLTGSGAITIFGICYAVLSFMGVFAVIGSTANDPTITGSPTDQLTIGILTIGIMFVFAVLIVAAIRVSRKLR
jgi:hypothetical protein